MTTSLWVPQRLGFHSLEDWWKKLGRKLKLDGQFSPGQDVQMVDRGTQAPPSASPYIVNSASKIHSTAVTTHVANLPANIVAGNLLLVAISVNANNPPTTPSGWTLDPQLTGGGGGGSDRFNVFTKIASGAEGATLNITHASTLSASIAYQVTGNRNGLTTSEFAAIRMAAGTPPDPLSLTPTWGAADNLWIAFVNSAASASTITGYPTDYNLEQLSVATAGGSGGTVVAGCARILNAASDDPSAFTVAADSVHVAYTIAVRPL